MLCTPGMLFSSDNRMLRRLPFPYILSGISRIFPQSSSVGARWTSSPAGMNSNHPCPDIFRKVKRPQSLSYCDFMNIIVDRRSIQIKNRSMESAAPWHHKDRSSSAARVIASCLSFQKSGVSARTRRSLYQPQAVFLLYHIQCIPTGTEKHTIISLITPYHYWQREYILIQSMIFEWRSSTAMPFLHSFISHPLISARPTPKNLSPSTSTSSPGRICRSASSTPGARILLCGKKSPIFTL